mmetsp:Transcript_18226/g.48970  ORF Transcript_18226/g.48970 Transcript_18226/m.48970 type:complete len:209 (+) Transcript_18226:1129-1755(+)
MIIDGRVYRSVPHGSVHVVHSDAHDASQARGFGHELVPLCSTSSENLHQRRHDRAVAWNVRQLLLMIQCVGIRREELLMYLFQRLINSRLGAESLLQRVPATSNKATSTVVPRRSGHHGHAISMVLLELGSSLQSEALCFGDRRSEVPGPLARERRWERSLRSQQLCCFNHVVDPPEKHLSTILRIRLRLGSAPGLPRHVPSQLSKLR